MKEDGAFFAGMLLGAIAGLFVGAVICRCVVNTAWERASVKANAAVYDIDNNGSPVWKWKERP